MGISDGPRPLARLALLATALTAMTLAATAVHAQCKVGDVQMTKTYPLGNLSRTGTLISEAIINVSLPSTCNRIADPPLTICVNVWDTGNPEQIPVDATDTTKTVIRPANGWKPGGFHMVCNSDFLTADSQTPPNPQVRLPLLISVRNSSGGTHPPDNLILVMHNPTRYLKIPIDP